VENSLILLEEALLVVNEALMLLLDLLQCTKHSREFRRDAHAKKFFRFSVFAFILTQALKSWS
jgi:hypothetical protein